MIPETLKIVRNKKGMSQRELAEKLGVSQQTIGSWEVGRTAPDPEAIKKIADFFNVSTDYLLGKTDTSSPPLPSLNRKDEREITKLMDGMKEMLMQEKGLMFDGQPASEESIQSILDAMQIGMEMAKKRNKAKYTPKKYRRED